MPIYLGEASTKRRKQVIGAIAAVLILSFLIAFWQDIINFLAILINLKEIIFNQRSLLEWASPIQKNALLVLSYTCCLGFLGVFLFWLILLAGQSILPVNGFVDSYRTAWHLLLYMLRMHGPAVFVRDGQVLATKEDIREGPGIVVVDYNSAVVLESSPPLPGLTRLVFSFLHSMLMLAGLAERTVSPRTVGPGIVFTGRGEKIRAAVDLRKQFRLQPNITAYTRDGIEVAANVFSIFTIGQPADILQVTYVGEPRPENLRVITLQHVTEMRLRVTGLHDDLDADDRNEIHDFINRHVPADRSWLNPYKPPPSTNHTTFDSERVFAAVFSQARGEKDEILPWTKLPARFAAGVFREILSRVNYDQLYQLRNTASNPLAQYKRRMRLEMRNNGILSYRVLMHTNSQPFKLHESYPRTDLMISEIKLLQSPKFLRERGIRIIMASFGDITPVNNAIYQHRLESWKATWLRDTEIVGAEKELEAMRVRNQARAMAQQDIVASLNSILSQTDMPEEVLALRILQALETLAADTTTNQLLPAGTLDAMNAARYWLLSGNPPPPIQPTATNGVPPV
jgi:hypothetical protein